MGYYWQLKTKEIKLRKDIPKDVVEFINSAINGSGESAPPSHKLFTLKRWRSVFHKSGWYNNPCSYFNKDELKLFLWADIKYGYEEIEAFVDWISPYVLGHKPKEYIGFMKGEDDRTETNLYIERKCTSSTPVGTN